MKLDPIMLAMLNSMAAPYLQGREPDQVIGRGDLDTPYMQRWYLLRKQPTGPVENVYLHRFLRSDAEEPHDHPWGWLTLILRGSYVEWSPEGEVRREAGDFAFKAATDRHAIIAVEPGTVTLFLTGPKVREWGFWTADGWVHWEKFDEYRGARMSSARRAALAEREAPFRVTGLVDRIPREPGAVVIGGGRRMVAQEDGTLCEK